jgi:Tfp pilus assembly protein PilX
VNPIAPHSRGPRHESGRPPRGAAALVVVMVLFFIVALMAAYAGRNLIFEQRTSANQYRATQAFEAAEAGMEWALAMLNGGRIDTACRAHTDPATADDSFRQRYLAIDADTGLVDVRLRSTGEPLRAACVLDGTAWQCSCPKDGAPALVAPAGGGPQLSFVVRFQRNDPPFPTGSPAYPPGVVRLESIGCTRLDATDVCAPGAAAGDGRATVTVLAALKSALATPPTAAITSRGSVQRLGNSQLVAANGDQRSGGFTQHAGGTALGLDPPQVQLSSTPGTPPERSVIESDTALAGLSAARMFSSVFGMERDTYRLQPASVLAPCGADCDGATIRDLARLNPGRTIWIAGNLRLDVTDPIGTAAEPVVLIVGGEVQDTAVGAKVDGLIYQVGGRWTSPGAATVTGALIGEAGLDLAGNGTTTVVYDAAVLDRLRRTSGSFVRIPGSWRDF